jgi:hypothetical protein
MIEDLNHGNLDMFLYSHIPFKPIVSNPAYKILTCSKENFDTSLPVLRDYTGDNISDMNLMYNEYTGFYWIWKNYNLKKYIGLNHYRRLYTWCDNIPNMDDMFSFFDIVLNKPVIFKDMVHEEHNNYTYYSLWHNHEDFELLEEIINEKYPDYKDGFYKMKNAGYLYNSSMFIMKKETFLDYCNFIFPLLEEFRKRRGFNTTEDAIKWVEERKDLYIKPDHPYYDIKMQSRIIGYIAERALNAYLMNGDNSLEKRAAVIEWGMVSI